MKNSAKQREMQTGFEAFEQSRKGAVSQVPHRLTELSVRVGSPPARLKMQSRGVRRHAGANCHWTSPPASRAGRASFQVWLPGCRQSARSAADEARWPWRFLHMMLSPVLRVWERDCEDLEIEYHPGIVSHVQVSTCLFWLCSAFLRCLIHKSRSGSQPPQLPYA